MDETELISGLKTYVDWFENNMAVIHHQATDEKERMALYVGAKLYLERFS